MTFKFDRSFVYSYLYVKKSVGLNYIFVLIGHEIGVEVVSCGGLACCLGFFVLIRGQIYGASCLGADDRG